MAFVAKAGDNKKVSFPFLSKRQRESERERERERERQRVRECVYVCV